MVTIKIIRQKLIDWQNDIISKEELQQWAEDIKDSKILFESNLSERDEFIGLEVLHYLEFMNINTTIKKDIPCVIEFIDSKNNYKEAYKKWEKYRKSIDYKKRTKQLKNDPFYAPYCDIE